MKNYEKVTLADRADIIAMGIFYDQNCGERTIRPNNRGLLLLAIWDALVVEPLYLWKMKRCKHPNMLHTGYGNGDTGVDEVECPDCGFYARQVMY